MSANWSGGSRHDGNLQDSERTYSTPTRPKTNTTVGSPRTNQHTAADKTVNWHAHRLTRQPTKMPANWRNNQTSMTVNRHNSKPTQQQLTSGDPTRWQSNTRWMVAKRTDITSNTSGCRWGFDPAWPCDSDNIMVIYSSSIACIRLYRRWSCIVQHILSGNFTLHVRGTRWHIIHTVESCQPFMTACNEWNGPATGELDKLPSCLGRPAHTSHWYTTSLHLALFLYPNIETRQRS